MCVYVPTRKVVVEESSTDGSLNISALKGVRWLFSPSISSTPFIVCVAIGMNKNLSINLVA